MGHKARKLSQVNKSHKDSSKPKGNNKKPSLVKLNKKNRIDVTKELRVLQAEQRRKHSMKTNADSDCSKRGTNSSAPLLCGIFPLFEFEHTDVIFSLLKSTDPDAIITKIDDIENYKKLDCENFIMNSKKFKKNFAFVACRNFRDRFDYLDLIKVVDWCLFILPNDLDELIGDYTEDLISSIIAQGIPSSCFITLNDSSSFSVRNESNYFESITKLSMGDERIRSLTNPNDANKLMRHLSENCKPSFVTSKKSTLCSKSINKRRGYFLIQNMSFEEAKQELTLTSCMRGFGMDLNTTKYVHITGIGDFEMKEMKWISAEQSNRPNDRNGANVKSYKFDQVKESIEDDAEIDEEDSEDSKDASEEESRDSEEESSEEQVSDIGSFDSENDPNDDKMSFATTTHSGFSVAQIQKFKESRENSMFPDEVEISYTELAKERFHKYRGLPGFRNSIWPLNMNLPDCYGQLYAFSKYQHNRNRLSNVIGKLKRDDIDHFVTAGCKMEIILAPVSKDSWQQIETVVNDNPNRHLIGSNLFEKENEISVLHFNERRKADVDDSVVNALAKLKPNEDLNMEAGEEACSHYDDLGEKYQLKPAAEPIQSKESMLFQAGFRRFSATPIYSEFNADSDKMGNKGKAKYCKFMELKTDVVATVYGPLMFGPVPVLQFRIRQVDMGRPYAAELVASGSLLSVDPSRPIIKRILLTGQIYKVHKRTVKVRYMFFSTEDIEHFQVTTGFVLIIYVFIDFRPFHLERKAIKPVGSWELTVPMVT